jgi:hypothetical protein
MHLKTARRRVDRVGAAIVRHPRHKVTVMGDKMTETRLADVTPPLRRINNSLGRTKNAARWAPGETFNCYRAVMYSTGPVSGTSPASAPSLRSSEIAFRPRGP